MADPDRLATLVPHLAGVSVVCWLLGSATGPSAPQTSTASRLETLLAHIVDTPVRGLVYEAAGTVADGLLAEGRSLVAEAGERWRLPAVVVTEDPGRHEAWLAAMTGAVGEVLG